MNVIAIREDDLGSQHLQVALAMEPLADLYAFLGDYDKAIDLYEELIAIERERLQSDRAHLGVPLRSLGDALVKKGEYHKAEAVYLEALRFFQGRGGHLYDRQAQEVLAELIIVYEVLDRPEEATRYRAQMEKHHRDAH